MTEIHKVEDYMDKTFVTLKEDMDVYQAIDILLDKGITGAAVLDENRKIVGILSEKDCLRLLTRGSYFELPGGKVRDFMTREVFCVTANTDIFQIADMFLRFFFRRIIVKDENRRMVGQITRRDLLRIIKEFHSKEKPTKKAPIL